MCYYLMLEIKYFVPSKNEAFLFWMRVDVKESGRWVGELSFEGGLLIKGW